MKTVYDKMEDCIVHSKATNSDSLSELIFHLKDTNWRVRYAAAVALGDRRDPAAIPDLLQALRHESRAPLYSQPKIEHIGIHAGCDRNVAHIPFPEGTTERLKEAWRRRGRVCQAVIMALGNIGKSTPEILEYLHDYAVNQTRDYIVRAAACLALRQIGDLRSLPILKAATKDEEWCTACNARKGVAALGAAA